ncbi:MAG: hypothetical protein EOO20_25925 [Chryseobacterium sp.]|uniref:Uncharacterized protein n=1 Tax=Pedobacter duraquae TaxID=425511 RepID=A0A4V3C3S3_9SPHI|nr:hypothetical protein [Pedobacter duraquae]RZJ80531.1 MAG: hypothetical protein EOO20_25925 [Chryseobacterium sp.]TDO23178.1 hypothetical protein CLV32_2165 [Pedobacter duraquae]
MKDKSATSGKGKSDLQLFIAKFDPNKFKSLSNGIEIRGVVELEKTILAAKSLIERLGYNLEIVRTASMAAYGAFEVRELAA